jgi:hypothetical protein
MFSSVVGFIQLYLPINWTDRKSAIIRFVAFLYLQCAAGGELVHTSVEENPPEDYLNIQGLKEE